MTTSHTAIRNWHPIEEAIIEHIDRYGLSTVIAAHAAGVKGMNSPVIAAQRLEALMRRGDLQHQPLPLPVTAYALSPRSRSRLGRSEDSRSSTAPSTRVLTERYAVLAFCCLQAQQRMKLTPQELQQRFADLYRPGRAHRYYFTREGERPRLGFLRVDSGSFGRWDRIAASFADDLRHHLSMALVRRLLDEQSFELTLITALPIKAQRIEQLMAQYRSVLPAPVRIVAIPELVNFIRPAPD